MVRRAGGRGGEGPLLNHCAILGQIINKIPSGYDSVGYLPVPDQGAPFCTPLVRNTKTPAIVVTTGVSRSLLVGAAGFEPAAS
jgi:hypothetical protein